MPCQPESSGPREAAMLLVRVRARCLLTRTVMAMPNGSLVVLGESPLCFSSRAPDLRVPNARDRFGMPAPWIAVFRVRLMVVTAVVTALSGLLAVVPPFSVPAQGQSQMAPMEVSPPHPTILSPVTQAEDKLKVTEARTTIADGSILVAFADDLLTVNVKDMSLKELLQEVSRQSGLAIMTDASIAERMTIQFDKLPFDEGMRRIVRHQNVVLRYAQHEDEESQSAPPRLIELWILPKRNENSTIQTSQVDGSQPEDPGQEALRSLQLRAALSSERPRARRKAVEALGESGDLEAIAPLRLALDDADKGVREAAVTALANIGGDEAVESLDVAVQDEDFWVRKETVRALGKIGGERAALLLAQALTDEDEFIRDDAAEALEELKYHRR